ncbi:MAG: HAD family hydrolase [Chloroflexota bacterium]
MAVRAIIFDYGSVLVRMRDETPRILLAERYETTLDDLYRAIFDGPTAFPACLGTLTIHEHWDAVTAALNVPFAEKDAFVRQFWSADDLNRDLVSFIREQLHPRYKLGLLSNAWDDLRTMLMERWNILDDFDDVIISAEVGDAKPNASIYRLALDRLGVAPEETIFVDDILANVQGAQAVGIHAIQFLENEQLFAELKQLSLI